MNVHQLAEDFGRQHRCCLEDNSVRPVSLVGPFMLLSVMKNFLVGARSCIAVEGRHLNYRPHLVPLNLRTFRFLLMSMNFFNNLLKVFYLEVKNQKIKDVSTKLFEEKKIYIYICMYISKFKTSASENLHNSIFAITLSYASLNSMRSLVSYLFFDIV